MNEDEKMKVIIDIPEEDYKLACNHPEALIDCYARYLKDGTPLTCGKNDTISRKAAIDLIEHIETERLKGNIELSYAPAIKGLKTLPTAEPEITPEAVKEYCRKRCLTIMTDDCYHRLMSGQPEREELTPEEVASEIASGSLISAKTWLDIMIQIQSMGYAICRKK